MVFAFTRRVMGAKESEKSDRLTGGYKCDQ